MTTAAQTSENAPTVPAVGVPSLASSRVMPALGHKKHVTNIDHWASGDRGLRGNELREAAAFIEAQNAEIELLDDALRRVRKRACGKSAPQRDVWTIADRALHGFGT